ncbi:BMP family protein [Marasmitruncus massiliensis]|jgi:basic membrane protein A|uniref:BMP family protein n=1 Tax=Marasmitruncus massiliensis TaxID=1944642 RepID=UPI000C7D47BE|nr:BMP family protein [Marasmitruncus massiliensis]MBE6905243.1 BMP family ABC transporter substrate-binding protein [Oscillospiraceae bacterium]
MKKKLSMLLAALLVASTTLLGACGSSAQTAGSQSAPASSQSAAESSQGASEAPSSATGKNAEDYKIVLLLPGPINDQSWNATNYAGLEACNQNLGTKMEYVENVQASDFESTLREYAERGYDLVMAAGSQFDEAVANVAPNYKDTTFCVVNGSKCDGDNVAPIFPKEYEASYLASIIAGNVTTNGSFATIGGFPNEPMEHLMDVYETNAVAIAKERGIADSKATRAYANSWDDVALGKQMAEQMIDNGADTLFVYANEVGLGSIEAAKQKGAKVIGFSSDQTTIDPNTVVASVVFDFETFYVWSIMQYMDGTLTGNTVHEAGINEDIFKPVYTDSISQETKDAVDAGIQNFKDGKVDLKAMFAK